MATRSPVFGSVMCFSAPWVITSAYLLSMRLLGQEKGRPSRGGPSVSLGLTRPGWRRGDGPARLGGGLRPAGGLERGDALRQPFQQRRRLEVQLAHLAEHARDRCP